MKTVHFFAFYPHNLPKITDFSPRSSMNPKNTKYLHFDRDGWRCSAPLSVFRLPISPLQMRNQSSSNFSFRIFEILLLFLWWYTPAFRMIYPYFLMIYSCFHDEVAEYRLNPHEYGFEFVSGVDWNSSLPRIRNFQARKILVSSRENSMLNTRIHFITYAHERYSG